jgi:L-asparaginase
LPDRPTIGIVAAGGTIVSVGIDRLDHAWYPETGCTVEPQTLLDSLPESARFAEVELHTCPMTDGGPLPSDWMRVLRSVTDLLGRGVDGIVITHGTNPLEELAWFLHLTTRTDVPIVVTGAMRPANGLGADGPMNLLGAIRVAASPVARGLGVLVLMDEAILSARDVTKTSTHRLHAFQAPAYGPLGYVDADDVIIRHRPVRLHGAEGGFELGTDLDLPRVDIVVSHVGADGTLIDAAIGAGAQGLVNAGSGAGRPQRLEIEAMERAVAAGVVVCQASRTGSGRTTLSPWLRRLRFVAADDLQPWKARVLLSVALTHTRDLTEIQGYFDRY